MGDHITDPDTLERVEAGHCPMCNSPNIAYNYIGPSDCKSWDSCDDCGAKWIEHRSVTSIEMLPDDY